MAIHADYRIARAGIHLPSPILDTAILSLGALDDFRAALDGEPWARSGEPLSEILKSPQPAAFTKLWGERRADALAASLQSALGTTPTNMASFPTAYGAAGFTISRKE
jgi:hypothetical protein